MRGSVDDLSYFNSQDMDAKTHNIDILRHKVSFLLNMVSFILVFILEFFFHR